MKRAKKRKATAVALVGTHTRGGIKMRYLERDEQWKPKRGAVLVHNHVTSTPTMRQGTRGFRYWEQEPTSLLEPCSCGWRLEWGKHYRMSGKR
jgi:hypothetical protein